MIAWRFCLCFYGHVVNILNFSANLLVFLKNRSCRLVMVLEYSKCGLYFQECVKSQLKARIWKELFELAINSSQCNAEEHKYTLASAVWNIGIVDSVLLPVLLKAFVKLHYDDVYVSQWGNYPCSETQTYSFYLKKGSNCMESQASV